MCLTSSPLVHSRSPRSYSTKGYIFATPLKIIVLTLSSENKELVGSEKDKYIPLRVVEFVLVIHLGD